MELYPIDIAIHLVNILVLYLRLRMLIWKPVRKFMLDRENRIQSQLDDAAQLKAAAEQTKADYDQRMADVQSACEELLSEGRKQAQEAGQRCVDEAKAEAQHIVEQARADAREEKQRTLDESKEELASLAVELARRVLTFDEDVRHNIVAGTAEKKGLRRGTLKTAQPCSPAEIKNITAQLENILGCRLALEQMVDPNLVGGFAAYVDGRAYDFSYAAQLAALKQNLA